MLVKLHADREALVIPIGIIQEKSLVDEMNDILNENDATGEMGKKTKDAAKFWALRRNVDKRLKVRAFYCFTSISYL